MNNKSLGLLRVSSAQQGSIHLIQNTVKTFKYYCHLKQLFSMLKCNLFLWSKLYFQHHYSSLQCHMIFRNHNNMLICCSRNISDYYQCWKQLCCTIFLWKQKYILFFRIHRWKESSKQQHLFVIEICWNIRNVFTVTVEQLNASSMNKSFKLFQQKKSHWPQTFEW